MKGFLFVLLIVAFAAAKVSYDGHEVWRIESKSESEASLIHKLVTGFNLDVWSHSRSTIDVRVSPDFKRRVSMALLENRISYNVHIKDVGVLIKEEEERLAKRNPLEFTLDDYNTFEDVEAYLKQVNETSPYASLVSLGKSVENRDLWQLKISVGTGKPAVWFDFNIHAREWITCATGLYGIDLFTNNYGSDSDVTSLLDKYDLYIMVINNPDGYSFTWTEDRMWRKNRNKYDGDACYGVDINRNFDDHFGGAGTSDIACSETYHGPSPASEPETQATQNGIQSLIDSVDLDILFSIHSYSQLWMYPYGYTSNPTPDDNELNRVAEIGVNALTAVYGTQYVFGPVSTTIYPAASTTIDWSYAQGVKYSYTIELRDTGEYGFILPSDQIQPTAEETWAGIIASIMAI